MVDLSEWRLKTRSLPLRPGTLIIGILNVTPDSFSDGGKWHDQGAAVAHGLEMLEHGAKVIDVGGESTRPGALPLSAREEQNRVLAVIRGILDQAPDAIVSIDTYHAETAQAAVDAGAEIVNDVSGGLWDAAMRTVWETTRCGVVLMHTRGKPSEWRRQPPLTPDEVVPLVERELQARAAEALSAGAAREAIVVDPGFGFGKVLGENFPLLAGISRIAALGWPVCAGVSRKGFLKNAIEEIEPARTCSNPSEALRDATVAANTAAVLAGARVLRVHDVRAACRAAAVADRVLAGARDFTAPRDTG